ncbi:response regulator [Belnapia rosea]|uniref:response regulator n=1 Tax=Belnapia rosea TaxID=938405 RepID=UPI00088BE131|nr:response regulator [Belnapia rosea]SDB73829.1 His Kinase A (phospho-acceptor) domain-containing protein [Belnapia rosea]
METTAAEHRVLILAPRGRDAGLAAGILARAGIASRICADPTDLAQAAVEGAGAALVTEEALEGDNDNGVLLCWVATQPPWSDFPFVVLTAPRGDIAQGARAPAWLHQIGNAVLLERPLGAAALASAMRAALRTRQRQYETQAHLAERELVMTRLATLNTSLESRVAERTAELSAAYDQLKKESRERGLAEARLAQAQRMEALGQLAGGIAHDFNNVLQAVLGGLNLIQRRPGDPERVKRLAHMATDAAQRGASITGRLLAFARRGALRAEPVPPVPLLAELREMLAHTLGANVVMQVAADPKLPMLLADKGQLETVLVNLAVNARDAMPDGGTLLLGAAREVVLDAKMHPAGLAPGGYLRLWVSDTGTGMSAATLARASEPFFTTKPLGQGTGLGLAMARGFAHQSDGGFVIESVLGQGTTVTLWFPEAIGVSAASDPAPSGNTAPFVPAARILVVDDDAMVREVLVGEMKEQGYRVFQAGDGLEALAQLDKGMAVDLLISDFSMPGMNGLTLIQEARRRRPALPALLLTGYADASVRSALEGAEARSTALLRKPVSGAELAERAAALLAHAAAPGRQYGC